MKRSITKKCYICLHNRQIFFQELKKNEHSRNCCLSRHGSDTKYFNETSPNDIFVEMEQLKRKHQRILFQKADPNIQLSDLLPEGISAWHRSDSFWYEYPAIAQRPQKI